MENKNNTKPVTKAMILAGGLGTRFLPATLAVAKELVAIGNKPILLYHLKDLVEAGITDVLIVGNRFKEESFKNFLNPPKEYFDRLERDGKMGMLAEFYELMSKVNITYINQDDEYYEYNGNVYHNDLCKEQGSAIAIYAGRGWAGDDPFFVVNGDDLLVYDDGRCVTKEIIDVYNATGDYVMSGRKVDRDLIYKYSSMKIGNKINSNGVKMLDIVEKPPKGTETSNIMGFARYVYTSDFFDRVKKCKPRENGEYCMVDIFSDVAKEGNASACIFDGRYFDCGSIAGYSVANLYFGLRESDPSTSKLIESSAKDVLQGFKKSKENSPENK